jgi:hypothetical protein
MLEVLVDVDEEEEDVDEDEEVEADPRVDAYPIPTISTTTMTAAIANLAYLGREDIGVVCKKR